MYCHIRCLSSENIDNRDRYLGISRDLGEVWVVDLLLNFTVQIELFLIFRDLYKASVQPYTITNT